MSFIQDLEKALDALGGEVASLTDETVASWETKYEALDSLLPKAWKVNDMLNDIDRMLNGDSAIIIPEFVMEQVAEIYEKLNGIKYDTDDLASGVGDVRNVLASVEDALSFIHDVLVQQASDTAMVVIAARDALSSQLKHEVRDWARVIMIIDSFVDTLDEGRLEELDIAAINGAGGGNQES
ncbi:MAG: hypothetical protein HN337_00480, partial [Deltaproteobacteria bacterium]|nr:hypothetical protein [Deltaproteobacteria bacterium]